MITIKHPTLENYNLNLESLIGPENAVFLRGRLTGKYELKLPDYYREIVEERTISVHLTMIGSHQNVIIKRISEGVIYFQSQGNMPIDCYYLIFGERKDISPLKAEQRLDTEQ